MSLDWLHFFERTFPSANIVLVRGPRPLLIDTGFGSDVQETECLSREAGIPPQSLSLIVNTHYHSDHIGGNSRLQQRYGLPIAAHRWDAALVNQRDREACGAEWLNQAVEPYQVNRPLSEGDEIDTGRIILQVLHTPGYTLGHISLYVPSEQVLFCGDVIHRDDVAWINTFLEGPDALQRAIMTLDRVARLPLRCVYSGHGPAMDQPLVAIDSARRRYEKWLNEPEKVAWHACKRIFAYALMIYNGLPADNVAPYLLEQVWFRDYAHHVFECNPADFIGPLIYEMLRSKAAAWQEGQLVALTPCRPLPSAWALGPTRPRDWPK
jgi:hydroxyacylglutathione hydrolase